MLEPALPPSLPRFEYTCHYPPRPSVRHPCTSANHSTGSLRLLPSTPLRADGGPPNNHLAVLPVSYTLQGVACLQGSLCFHRGQHRREALGRLHVFVGTFSEQSALLHNYHPVTSFERLGVMCHNDHRAMTEVSREKPVQEVRGEPPRLPSPMVRTSSRRQVSTVPLLVLNLIRLFCLGRLVNQQQTGARGVQQQTAETQPVKLTVCELDSRVSHCSFHALRLPLLSSL
mmetsp:Transcript_29381/g.57691  ORF Transcript_29381/g.57691 Transcript_29381/m.57691 type:complete len:229 (-) Transcript_29381:406-1092(-)